MDNKLTSGVRSSPRRAFVVADFPVPVSPVTAIRISFWYRILRFFRISFQRYVASSPETPRFLAAFRKSRKTCNTA